MLHLHIGVKRLCAWSAVVLEIAQVQIPHMPPHPKPTVGKRHFLREWRKSKHLSQEQVEEATGIDRTIISKVETGKLRYDQPMLETLSELYGCTPADLIMRNPLEPDSIYSIWDNAKPAERRQIVEIARTLLRTGSDG